jgi:hypothetical protein
MMTFVVIEWSHATLVSEFWAVIVCTVRTNATFQTDPLPTVVQVGENGSVAYLKLLIAKMKRERFGQSGRG